MAFCALCDHCEKPLTDLETAWSLWHEPASAPNGRWVPIDHLHEECIKPALYQKSKKIKGARWYGCLLMDMKEASVMIHEFDPSSCSPTLYAEQRQKLKT